MLGKLGRVFILIASAGAIFWPGAYIFGFPGVMRQHWQQCSQYHSPGSSRWAQPIWHLHLSLWTRQMQIQHFHIHLHFFFYHIVFQARLSYTLMYAVVFLTPSSFRTYITYWLKQNACSTKDVNTIVMAFNFNRLSTFPHKKPVHLKTSDHK